VPAAPRVSLARGATALVVRHALVQMLQFVGASAVAREIGPFGFGTLGIALFACGVLGSTAGAGLGASLIRSSGEPEPREVCSLFTVQLAFSAAIVAILWPAIDALAAHGRWNGEQAMVARCVAAGLLFSAFQSLPTALLERRLDFPALARIEVVQAVVFQIVAVSLARSRLGVRAIGLAVLARAGVGAVLAIRAAGWRPGLALDPSVARRHLRFGIPFQGTRFVHLIRDAFAPVAIGSLLGVAAVGRVAWAQMIAVWPVWGILALDRLYLPALARARAHESDFRDSAARLLASSHVIVAPFAVLTLVWLEPATRIFYGETWLSALPLVYPLWLATLVAPTSTVSLAVLEAAGDAYTPLRYAVLWAAATWILGIPLVAWLGVMGFAVANVAIQASIVWLVRDARRHVPLAPWQPMVFPWLVAIAAVGLVRFAASGRPPASWIGLMVPVASSLALYAAIQALLRPDDARALRAAIDLRRREPA